MGKQGAVLIACLWVLAILSVMAGGLARGAGLDLKQARFEREKIEARFLCRSQITRAMAGLKTEKPLEKQSGLSVVDLGGRINLRVEGELGRQLIVELLLKAGASGPEVEELADIAVDWIDVDTVNSADKEREPDFFKNGPLNNPYELLAVMEYFYEQNPEYGTVERARQLYNAMAGAISVYPESGININSAGAGVLEIFLTAVLKNSGMNELIPEASGLARKIARYGEGRGFEEARPSAMIAALSEGGLTSEEINIINQLDGRIEIKSNHFQITSEQRAGDCRKRITIVYNRGRDRFADWHED